MGRDDENTLVEQYMHLVKQIARRSFSSRLPDDDLLQSGRIGLWEAAQHWSGKGEFEPFAKSCIYHNMMDYVRSLNAKKRNQTEELQDQDDYTLERFDDLDVMELCDDIQKVWQRGTQENEILHRLAVGSDKRALAAELGLTTYQLTRIAKRAWRAVLRAREGNRISTG